MICGISSGVHSKKKKKKKKKKKVRICILHFDDGIARIAGHFCMPRSTGDIAISLASVRRLYKYFVYIVAVF